MDQVQDGNTAPRSGAKDPVEEDRHEDPGTQTHPGDGSDEWQGDGLGVDEFPDVTATHDAWLRTIVRARLPDTMEDDRDDHKNK